MIYFFFRWPRCEDRRPTPGTPNAQRLQSQFALGIFRSRVGFHHFRWMALSVVEGLGFDQALDLAFRAFFQGLCLRRWRQRGVGLFFFRAIAIAWAPTLQELEDER